MKNYFSDGQTFYTNCSLYAICNDIFYFFLRVIQNRIIMAVICLAILGVIGLVIYYSVK